MNATSRLSGSARNDRPGQRGPLLSATLFLRRADREVSARAWPVLTGDGQKSGVREGHNKNAVRYCFRTK